MTSKEYNELYYKYLKERNIPKLLDLIEERTIELVHSMEIREYSNVDSICIIAATAILNKVYKKHADREGLILTSDMIVDRLMKSIHTECISFTRGNFNENKA